MKILQLLLAVHLMLPKAAFCKLTVHIIYESMEPESMNLLMHQVYPIYDDIKEQVDLHPLPFGQAKILDGEKIEYCIRGPGECMLNAIHLCAFTMDISTEKKLEFIFCTFTAENPGESLEFCAVAMGMSWERLNKCLSSEARYLIRDLINTTNHLLHGVETKIPTFFYRETYVEELQQDSKINFLGTICGALQDEIQPAVCDENQSDLTTIAFFWFIVVIIIVSILVGTGLTLGFKLNQRR